MRWAYLADRSDKPICLEVEVVARVVVLFVSDFSFVISHWMTLYNT